MFVRQWLRQNSGPDTLAESDQVRAFFHRRGIAHQALVFGAMSHSIGRTRSSTLGLADAVAAA